MDAHTRAAAAVNKYDSIPDFLNDVVAAFPGTGTVLGSNVNTGQRSNRFSGVISLRSVLTPRMTNEFRGLNGGATLFFDAIGSSELFSQWRGYQPFLGNTTSTTTPYLSGTTTAATSSRWNSPVKEFSDTKYAAPGTTA